MLIQGGGKVPQKASCIQATLESTASSLQLHQHSISERALISEPLLLFSCCRVGSLRLRTSSSSVCTRDLLCSCRASRSWILVRAFCSSPRVFCSSLSSATSSESSEFLRNRDESWVESWGDGEVIYCPWRKDSQCMVQI